MWKAANNFDNVDDDRGMEIGDEEGEERVDDDAERMEGEVRIEGREGMTLRFGQGG